ncbi:hypothetical protein COV18_04765 [Candidatus Woesearchaeota archaeon CG10_big_fil_rev_8_21_14_0_10_37_12]|nr:MAG: hypothetical protein COV18_04765 [Candidatus Woesearchaeota archaeon CG10_big_fil_rev_8_21_14_0_10_37_12]
MKRKVIQIADSTQLISLPRKWALKNNVKKGEELDVIDKANTLTISCDTKQKAERAIIRFSDYGALSARAIFGLYRFGVDEMKILVDSPDEFQELLNISHGDAVGFEMVEQGTNYCLLKNIAGDTQGFETMLRRTFLLLQNMADEGVKALKKGDQSALKNLIMLEKSNNRFTTVCRRHVNKHEHDKFKSGPLYAIIEELENIADEYKYLFEQLKNVEKGKLNVTKEHIELYDKLAQMIRLFHEAFYKEDHKKLATAAELRKEIVNACYKRAEKDKGHIYFALNHHALILAQRVFNMVGPYLAMKPAKVEEI